MIPRGMDLKRQWYLFEESHQFCSSTESIETTHSHPKYPKPKSHSVLHLSLKIDDQNNQIQQEDNMHKFVENHQSG